MGVGIHGEPGRQRMKLSSANTVAEQMVGAILADYDNPAAGGDVLLFVNGFGGTPAIELYLMYNAARRILEKRGLTVTRSLVGSYVTSLEMAGCSITVTLLDAKLAAFWDDHVHTAALRWRRPVAGAGRICSLRSAQLVRSSNFLTTRSISSYWPSPACSKTIFPL